MKRKELSICKFEFMNFVTLTVHRYNIFIVATPCSIPGQEDKKQSDVRYSDFFILSLNPTQSY